jgi:hypothetical protein
VFSFIPEQFHFLLFSLPFIIHWLCSKMRSPRFRRTNKHRTRTTAASKVVDGGKATQNMRPASKAACPLLINFLRCPGVKVVTPFPTKVHPASYNPWKVCTKQATWISLSKPGLSYFAFDEKKVCFFSRVHNSKEWLKWTQDHSRTKVTRFTISLWVSILNIIPLYCQ